MAQLRSRGAPSDPTSLARLIRTEAPRAVKIGLETGATSVWLWHALRAEGLPMVCLDARQAHAALSIRPSKADRNSLRLPSELRHGGDAVRAGTAGGDDREEPVDRTVS
jgi:transposase